MRIDFYAPMKAPDDPRPSGDRRMARLLMRALSLAGHHVIVASRFRSYDGSADPDRQARLAELGERIGRRLLARYQALPRQDRPELWFTYHLYHKAPDWIGPIVSRGLDIPYVAAEASHAGKQERGPWSRGWKAAADAIAHADLIIHLNSADVEGVDALVADTRRMIDLKPMLETAPYQAARFSRSSHRARLARACTISPSVPLLLTVAMMRPGAKTLSYQLLAEALSAIRERPWHLAVVGDGPARDAVTSAFASLVGRVTWLGLQDEEDLPYLYAAADLFVWPAINEAYGMALLEAQAAGVPVIAGRNGGVADVVTDGESGVLVPPNDVNAFASAIENLLEDDERRRRLAESAAGLVRRHHDLVGASRLLDRALVRVAERSKVTS